MDIGFKPSMVYMALGKPERKITRKTVDGESFAWVYTRYTLVTEYASSVGARGIIPCRRGRTYVEPITQARQGPYEAIRILFENDLVAVIEAEDQ